MPVIVRCAVKPTPSIGRPQQTVQDTAALIHHNRLGTCRSDINSGKIRYTHNLTGSISCQEIPASFRTLSAFFF